MRKEIYQKIMIPEGIEVHVEDGLVKIKGPQGENQRKFQVSNFTLEKKGDHILIGDKKATKSEKKLINTDAVHIRNMIKGVQEKYEYKLKICFSHFPMTVEVKGDEAIIKNFLGEKIPRKVKIPKGAEVKVDKEFVTVKAINKETAGQAAANFEKATFIRLRDRRIFQDGIFITSKAGREI